MAAPTTDPTFIETSGMQEWNNNKRDSMRLENEFLKLKMMLETGAVFGGTNEDLPPEVENHFLNTVMEFERQFANAKKISIRERLGPSFQYQPVSEISDADISKAWKALRETLFNSGFSVEAINPVVTHRELYRFVTEELLSYEVDDLHVRGMVCCFTYDEFHPDPVFESKEIAVDGIMRCILSPQEMQASWLLAEKDILLNTVRFPNPASVLKKIQQFQRAYDDFADPVIRISDCKQVADQIIVLGNYRVLAAVGPEQVVLSGNWKVVTMTGEQQRTFPVVEIVIEGISF